MFPSFLVFWHGLCRGFIRECLILQLFLLSHSAKLLAAVGDCTTFGVELPLHERKCPQYLLRRILGRRLERVGWLASRVLIDLPGICSSRTGH